MSEVSNKNQEIKEKKKSSTVKDAIELCANMRLYIDQKGRVIAAIPCANFYKVFLVSSKEIKRHIRNLFYAKYQKPLNSNALKEVIETLEARAFNTSREVETFVRVGNTQDKIFVDLCNKACEIVEVSSEGVQVTNKLKVHFLRNDGMSELPRPIDGSIAHLKNILKVNDQNFYKILAWLIGAYWGRPPFPVLIIQGGQGSGKSTLTEMIRGLVDPSAVPLRGVVTNEQDLVVTANTSYVLVMDNVSEIKPTLSDILCRISTGGGFSKRQLFTDSEEVLFKIANPIIINGIDTIPDRPDLLERALFVELEPISCNRKTQRQMLNDFYDSLPNILGGIFTMLSNGLKVLPIIHIENPPRLADFAYLLKAVEEGNGLPSGVLYSTIDQSQSDLLQYSIESNSFITAIIEYLKVNYKYEGTVLDLLDQLNKSPHVGDKFRSDTAWPKSPSKAGTLISRFEKYLNKVGICVTRSRSPDKHGARIIKIALGE